MSYAILIDGGFVRRKLGKKDSFVTVEAIQSLIEKIREQDLLKDKELYRVFFYDARPLNSKAVRPLNGGTEDFGESTLNKNITSFFRQVKDSTILCNALWRGIF